MILRNIPISLSEEEKTALDQRKLPIIRTTRITNKSKLPIPLCAVELTPTEDTNKIYHIKEIEKAIISVAPRRNAANIHQCHNCQKYGHTKNYCSLPPRCVKCSGEHYYTECKKKKADLPKCSNCDGPHPANYRGCNIHKEKKNNPRQQNRNNLPTTTPIPRTQSNQNQCQPTNISHYILF